MQKEGKICRDNFWSVDQNIQIWNEWETYHLQWNRRRHKKNNSEGERKPRLQTSFTSMRVLHFECETRKWKAHVFCLARREREREVDNLENTEYIFFKQLELQFSTREWYKAYERYEKNRKLLTTWNGRRKKRVEKEGRKLVRSVQKQFRCFTVSGWKMTVLRMSRTPDKWELYKKDRIQTGCMAHSHAHWVAVWIRNPESVQIKI